MIRYGRIKVANEIYYDLNCFIMLKELLKFTHILRIERLINGVDNEYKIKNEHVELVGTSPLFGLHDDHETAPLYNPVISNLPNGEIELVSLERSNR